MSLVVSYLSRSESDTDYFAERLAEAVEPGLTIALNGQLGSGKTRLVRGLCRALGADESLVNSPTFVLMQLYTDGRIPVAHFDTYRLGDPEEFLAIGAGEYLQNEEWLNLVEWAERVAEILPRDLMTIRIRHTAETERHFEVSGSGPVSRRCVDSLDRLLK